MRRLLLALTLVLTLATPAAAADPGRPASHSRTTYRAEYTIAASEALVEPDDPRTVTFTVTPLEGVTVDLVVVQVLLTSLVTVDAAHAPFCEQPYDERGGGRFTMTCIFLQVDEALDVTFHLQPWRMTLEPIHAACALPWYVGTPISVSEGGGEVFYQLRVWSPYQPGYCTRIPTVTR